MTEQLRELRKRRGLSQEALAAAVNVSREWIVKVETGREPLSDELAARVARLFGVAPVDVKPDYRIPESVTAEEKAVLEAFRSVPKPYRDTALRNIRVICDFSDVKEK